MSEALPRVVLPIMLQERYYGSEIQAMLDEWNAALSASPTPPEGGEPVAWRCASCGCHSYARVDVRSESGAFEPGPNVRCVNCKDVSFFPAIYAHPSPDTGALREALRDLLGLCEAGGDPFDEPGRPTVARARAALNSTKG